MHGVISTREAISMAQEVGLDLVEISPTAVPPVAKILDYGKFKYEAQKLKNEARKKQKVIEIKEIKMRPGIDDHDYDVKKRAMIRFLEEGDKVKITLRFRGREMAHQEFGVRLLERVRTDLEPYAVVESFPRMEGRQMVMLLAPKKVAPKPAHPVNKPEAGKPQGEQVSEPAPKASESTAVGSK
jgi:translation initiation factor IF-3